LAKLRIVEFATLTSVDWFDNRRSLEPVGDITPAQAESAIARCRTSQPSHLLPERRYRPSGERWSATAAIARCRPIK